MSNMLVEAKRVKAGQSLSQYETTGMNAINQLKAIKTQLLSLKSTVNSDADFTPEDADVVQGVIDNLATEIAGILG